MPLTTAQILNNRYRIVSLLGQGGFGAVYRAWDLNLKCACAIKENLDPSPDTQRQFEREAQVLATLHHPNLVGVMDFFDIPNQGQYLVMDFIDGEDLDCLLTRQGKVEPQTALGWIDSICQALEYLHTQNPPIFHRDIKPANIRLNSKGEPVLVDFGLVKVYTAGQKTTMGARAVTPGYSPPEQYGHSTTDARSDVYALAATLYALLTGAPPEEAIQRFATPQLKSVALPNTKTTGRLNAVLDKALQVHAVNRYDSAAEFRKALASVNIQPTVVIPTSQVGSSTQPSRGLWIWLPVIGLGLSLLWGYNNLSNYRDYQSSYFDIVETADASEEAYRQLEAAATTSAEGYAAQLNDALSTIDRQQVTIEAQSLRVAEFPTVLSEIENRKRTGNILYGPENGELTLNDSQISEWDTAQVDVLNLMVEVDFINRDELSNRDGSYYVEFRRSADSHYLLMVGKSFYYLVHKSGDDDSTVLEGTVENFLTGIGEINRITVICQDDLVWLYLNNILLGVFDDMKFIHGDVLITDSFNDRVENAQPTLYRNFTVWELP